VLFGLILSGLLLALLTAFPSHVHAQAAVKKSPISGDGGGLGDGQSGGTISPDLFTGVLSYDVPIVVPPGRHGVEPNLSLTYNNTNTDNPSLGTGWALELGAVERRTKNELNYSGDDYLLRPAGGGSEDLIATSPGVYRDKTGGQFFRVTKLTAPDGKPYFQVTDKSGRISRFGYTAASRQDNPADATQIFRWGLDQVTDLEGNSMTISYTKTPLNTSYQGQLYPAQIAYSGNTVTFYPELRPNAPDMFNLNFKVNTAYRIKTIDVMGAGGNHLRTYKLVYTADSLLSKIKQFGSDASVDASGTITNASTASVLPPISLVWDMPPAQLASEQYTGALASNAYGPGFQWLVDVNGDGMADFVYRHAGSRELWVSISTGTGFLPASNWGAMASEPGTNIFTPALSSCAYCFFADVDGDGKLDFVYNPIASGIWHTPPASADVSASIHVMKSTGSSFGLDTVWGTRNYSLSNVSTSKQNKFVMTVDVNRDGKADYVYLDPYNFVWVKLSDGSASFGDEGTISYLTGTCNNTVLINVCGGWGQSSQLTAPSGTSGAAPTGAMLADLDGDGYPDLLVGWSWTSEFGGSGSAISVKRNLGTSFDRDVTWCTENKSFIHPPDLCSISASATWLADVNGDGKQDVLVGNGTNPNQFTLWRSTGTGFDTPVSFTTQTYASPIFTDMNGDGLADLAYFPYPSGTSLHVLLSNGSSFGPETTWATQTYDGAGMVGDTTGDGKPDLAYVQADTSNLQLIPSTGAMSPSLTGIANGLGGGTLITYAPSTQYTNTLLPFPVQTVGTVTTCSQASVTQDANNNPLVVCENNPPATTYAYAYGYYSIAEQDFRGFNRVTVTGPAGPNNEQSKNTTWFHQGNDLAVDVNNPGGSAGYMKGKPYRVRVKDGAGNIFAETTTSYASDYDPTAAHFHPPQVVDTYTCDGTSTTICGSAKQTEAQFFYDCQLTSQCYGNLLEEEYNGDVAVSTDNRTVSRTFTPNDSLWLVGLPATETVYSGIGTGGTKLSDTRFSYDGATSYTAVPVKGHLTKVERWLDTSNSWLPTATTYDSVGNPKSVTDALSHTTTNCYDAGGTYLQSVTNALGQTAKTDYYGIGWNSACGGAPTPYAGTGLYGQVKSVTDANGHQTTTTYDTLGRSVLTTFPDSTWTQLSYPTLTSTTNQFGVIGLGGNGQHLRTDSTAGLWSESYFDGAGRTVATRGLGPEGRTVLTQTVYNKTGTVKKSSLPYFESGGTPSWNTATYDALGRTLVASAPDGSNVQSCYTLWTTGTIDPSGHLKKVIQDGAGHPLTVKEFTGTATNCASAPTLYATTQYQYDPIGRLIKVTDAQNHLTTMRYDSLGRKLAMADPDMGNCGDLSVASFAPAAAFPWYPTPCWNYQYDAVGNLLTQQDAKGQTISFGYDALNRVTIKQTPPLITAVTSGAITTSGATLTWTTDEAATSQVEYGPTLAYGGSTSVNTAMVTSHTVSLTGLTAGTLYHYRVKSRNTTGNLAVSGDATLTTAAQPDLIMSAVTPNASTVSATSTLAVANSAKNQGTSAAGGFTVGFTLSPTANYADVNAVALATTRAVTSLAAGGTSTATTTLAIPLTTLPGLYYVCAKADTANTVDEGATEGNNTRCSSSQVTMPAPDLLMTVVSTATPVVAPGKTLVLANTVTNQGGIKTGGFTIGFTLSPTANYADAAAVTFTTTRSLTTLAAGASSAVSTTLTIPATTPFGAYYLCVMADTATTVNEGANEGNNSRCTSARVQVSDPDLVLTALAPAAATVNQGATLSVTDTLANQGGLDTGASIRISYHLSTDKIYGNADDVVITTYRTVSGLAVGTNNTATTTLTIPAATPPGAYDLCAMADSLNTVVETGEDNNTRCSDANASGIMQITVPPPDLIMSTGSASATSVAAGKTFSLPNSVVNNGGSKAGTFVISFHLSTNTTWGDGDDLVMTATRSVSSLAIGATSASSTTLTVPAGTASGAYYVCAMADSGNTVAEQNETNNVSCTGATLSVP
jgi:YD repeat-containing protein